MTSPTKSLFADVISYSLLAFTPQSPTYAATVSTAFRSYRHRLNHMTTNWVTLLASFDVLAFPWHNSCCRCALIVLYSPYVVAVASQFSSVLFRMVSMHSEKPILMRSAPPRLWEVHPALRPLKRFRRSSDWRWPPLVLSRKIVERFLLSRLSLPNEMSIVSFGCGKWSPILFCVALHLRI